MSLRLQPHPHAADTGGVGLSANSFADVYVAHMPEITRYCRSILRDREDAEDAAQNAMERALKALSDGPAPERMRPWLFTIAQREAVNVLRRRGRDAPADIDEAALGGTSSPEDVAAVRERLAELLADVRELSPRQREVLVARELGGKSYRQIATGLGTTEAAAQQLVLEARQSLRQFEAGRSLACGEVQSWISAHDHARVRTRRVRAHLRSCTGCRGFETGIAARRRDFGLLLPGVGTGGAWWSWLATLAGQGGGKLIAAGAVVATGATIAATVPLQDRHPNPATPAVAAAPDAPAAQEAAWPVHRSLRGTSRRPRIAGAAVRRVRSGAQAKTGLRPQRSLRAPAPPGGVGAGAAAVPAAAPPAPAPRAAPVQRPSAAPAEPAPDPAPAPAPAQQVLEAAQPVADAVGGVVADAVGALQQALPVAAPALP